MAAAAAEAVLPEDISHTGGGLISSPDASALSMQQFLLQETFCAEPHTDTDIANLLQEISRLQVDGHQSDHNTDRDIEDIISEAEILVSESSKKIDSLASSVTSLSHIKRDTYLPYRSLLGNNPVKLKKSKQSSSNKVITDCKLKTKEDTYKSNTMQNPVKVIDIANSDDLDVKAVFASKIPSKESLNVSEERFASSFLQINEVTNSCEPKKYDGVHKKLKTAQEELKDTKEKLQSIQVQHELLTESSKELKILTDDLMKEKKAQELKLLERDDIISKLHKELESVKQELVQLQTEITNLREESGRLREEKQNLTNQANKDRINIQDLQRQCKEMENILMRKHPDSVSALIVASKQPTIETETKKLLEKRISCLESDLKTEEGKHQKSLSNIQSKVNSMKANYETHIADLEKQVINLQQLNFGMKEKLKTKEYKDHSTQTSCNNSSIAVQTNNVKPPSAKLKNQSAPSSVLNVANGQIKEDTHLMATVRGLNSEIVLKDKNITKLTKELEEAKKTIQKLQKNNKDGGHLTKVSQVEKSNVRKQIPKSNVKVMKISSDALNNNMIATSKEHKDKEKTNIKNELNVLQKDYETLKKKRIDDLVELQTTHEKELMNLNLKVLPLQHDVESLNSTVEMLRGQIKSMDEQLSIIMTERDHFKYRAEQLHCKLGHNSNLENNIPGKLSYHTMSDRDYDDLRTKVMELEKRYEGREVRLKTLINSLAKIRDAHSGGSLIDSGNCAEVTTQTYRSC